MKFQFNFRAKLLIVSLASAAVFAPALLQNADAAKKRVKAKVPAKATVPGVFYDTDWQYRVATLYGEKKNIIGSVSGNARFNRNGTYEQNYYIGGIGNFYKGKYKIAGNNLTTFDEKGKKVFDFKFTVGTKPPILVLSMMDKGKKSIDYSLRPPEKKTTKP